MVAVTAIMRARVAAIDAPRAGGTEDAIELFSGMLFGWIRCQPQERMPAENLFVLFERIMYCKENLLRAFLVMRLPRSLERTATKEYT